MDDRGNSTPGQAAQTPQKQKKRGKPVRTTLGVGALLALLFLGYRFGLGGGLGVGTGVVPAFAEQPAQQETAQTAQVVQATPAQAAPSPSEVVVSEDAILYMGETVTPETLRELLLENCPAGARVTLRDDKAIKAVYDSAKGVLDELALPYEEAR